MMKQDSWAFGPVKEPRAKRHVRFRRKAVTLAMVAGVFALSSVASAAWLASASNQHAAGKYGSLQAVVTVVPTTGAGDLFPNSNGALYVKFSNPNSQAVTVASIDAAAATFAGCTTPAASLIGFDSTTLYTNGGAGWSVPGGGVLAVTLNNKVAIGANPSNDCQAATLDVGGLTINTTT